MTRIPGAGRSSAPPSLERKEEHGRDVASLDREDGDRWGAKLVTRERGAALVPGGGKRTVTRVSKLHKRAHALPPALLLAAVFSKWGYCPSPTLPAFQENH